MTFGPTEEERQALEQRAAADGISMQEAARRAVREYVGRTDHRARVAESGARIARVHAEALDRLGR